MKNLQVQELTLAFADREILRDVSFNMNEKTRSALAGANGCGKSTLLKALTGEIQSDSRKVSITKGSRISYLPQSDIVLGEKSVYDTAEEGYARFQAILDEIKECEERTGNGGKEALSAAERLSELHEILVDSGYWDRKSRIETILMGLGFSTSDFNRPAKEFSGGYQMRIALARILVENPDFLLLDEPTNYLDIEAMTWLEEYLKGFNGGLMVVSHDQEFLDDLVTEVYELFNGKLTRYAGNYTKYTETRAMEIEALEKARKRQEEEMEKTEEFIERFRYKATKAKQVQSRIKMMEKIETIEVPGHLKKLHFSFPPSPHSGNDVMVVENFGKKYGDNVIYKDFSFLVSKGERLAITGRNGAGKSTLLRILAGVDDDYTGVVKDGAGVIKGYFAQDTEKTLNPDNDLIEELETIADTKDQPRLRNMLGAFLFSDDDVFKKVKVLSGGEKSRLALLKILLHPSNLLLLDEPTNHLDINAKEMLLEAIKNYEGTVIFVSHDKHFIKNLATRILYISQDGPEFFTGGYDYFEYKLEEKEAQWKVERNKTKEKPEAKPVTSYQEMKTRRNKIRTLEKELESLSKEMEKIEEEISLLTAETEKSEVYSVPAKINSVMKKKEEKEKELEEKEELWLEKSEELEALNGENN
ncbi:MAG: ABC-F family ATP-binding cassette domain-containing protein [Candidatus Ornithospirochaeta sp.]